MTNEELKLVVRNLEIDYDYDKAMAEFIPKKEYFSEGEYGKYFDDDYIKLAFAHPDKPTIGYMNKVEKLNDYRGSNYSAVRNAWHSMFIYKIKAIALIGLLISL